jgi:hypothetical protein
MPRTFRLTKKPFRLRAFAAALAFDVYEPWNSKANPSLGLLRFALLVAMLTPVV